ncbi:hypothetical protein [Pseudomonas phage Shamal]
MIQGPAETGPFVPGEPQMPITEQQLLPQDEWRAIGKGVAAYEAER